MTTSPTPMPRPLARRRVGLLCASAIAVLVLDQATKTLALERLAPGERIPVLGDLIAWRLVFNPGAAFSFGTGYTWIFTVVMAVVSVAVLTMALRVRSRWWAFSLGALLGGALGNLVDRVSREPGFGIGHVVDFIDYGYFIGNVADIAIVGAAVVMVVLSLVGLTWDGRREHGKNAEPAALAGQQDVHDGAVP